MKDFTRSSLSKILSFCSILVLMSACSPSADELYENARLAAQNKNFAQAIELYRQVKTAAQDQVEFIYKSQYGESEVYRVQQKLTKQKSLLEGMIANESFAQYKALIAEKLEENYLAQASQANIAESPTKATEFLEKAIKLNPKSKANRELLDLLYTQGDIEYQKKNLEQALDFFKRAQALRVDDENMQKKIENSINKAKFQQYRIQRAEKIFATQFKSLESKGIYDAKNKNLLMSVVVEVDGKVNRKNKEDMQKEGVKLATPVMQKEIVKWVKNIFAVKGSMTVNPALFAVIDQSFAKRAKRVRREKKRVYVTDFNYKVSIGLEQVYRLAYQGSQSQAQTKTPKAQKKATK